MDDDTNEFAIKEDAVGLAEVEIVLEDVVTVDVVGMTDEEAVLELAIMEETVLEDAIGVIVVVGAPTATTA